MEIYIHGGLVEASVLLETTPVLDAEERGGSAGLLAAANGCCSEGPDAGEKPTVCRWPGAHACLPACREGTAPPTHTSAAAPHLVTLAHPRRPSPRSSTSVVPSESEAAPACCRAALTTGVVGRSSCMPSRAFTLKALAVASLSTSETSRATPAQICAPTLLKDERFLLATKKK